MKIPLSIVDAFTVGKKSFTGNPAAVCLLDYDDDLSDNDKQKIAAEMNLSETVFVSYGWSKSSTLEKKRLWRTIRWFTPTNEVDLCGHATLASAKILFDLIRQDSFFIEAIDSMIEFESKTRGNLMAKIDWFSELITLNFPSNPSEKIFLGKWPWINLMTRLVLGPNLGVEEIQDIQLSPGMKLLLIRLKAPTSESTHPSDQLKQLRPNYERIVSLYKGDLFRDILVTIKGNGKQDEPDFYSRVFAPLDGINEDPVTGSAHTVLAPYWTQEFMQSFHQSNEQRFETVRKPTLWGRQVSGRGGDILCHVDSDRVKLSGQAVLTFRGELTI